ncbi:MAG: penicillin acylase family protein [Kofleriaceae bacterium]
MRPVAILALAAACSTPGQPRRPARAPAPPPATAPGYHAQVRWTGHGVPHIVAADVGGLGFGQGYTQARAHLCELADDVVRVAGERARYLGRGPGDRYLRSDLVHRHLGYRDRAAALLPTASADTQAMLAGFAAGYNLALARTPVAQQPAACRGAPWLRPITAVDVAAIGLALQGLASTRFLTDAIADAAPGATGAPLPPADGGASNAWAIGAERTASGGGILIGNPHFPWHGDLLFHEAHLTIPGQLDVYGAALVGAPMLQIAAAPRHAWSHTFSASTHMVVYRLALTAQSALRYRHGDDTLAISPVRYTIAVAGEAPVTRTLYRTAVGPMITTAAARWDGPGGHAFTVRDVAAGGLAAIDQYLAMARAQSRAQFEAALAMHHTPFVNTIYADAAGDALYVDGSRVPALSPQALAGWKLLRKLAPPLEEAWRQGLVVVDGSDPTNDLITDDDRAPGAIPIDQAPRVLRRDFVANANDSFRFTNLAAPETTAPASPLWGDDADRPSLRTLANLAALAPGAGPAGADDRFTLDEAGAAMLSNVSFPAARLRDELAAACVPPPGRPDPIGPACAALTGWDGRFAVDSRGALLWRELVDVLSGGGAIPWQRRFDRQAPRLTPDGLALDRAQVRAAIDRAAAQLTAAGLALDAPLGAGQQTAGATGPRAVPGGREADGVANVVTWNAFDATALTAPAVTARYPVNFGTSFVLAAELTPTGRTVKALLTYGNSSDPASPWYRDQLDAFARGELRPVPLTDAAIAADPAYRLEELDTP